MTWTDLSAEERAILRHMHEETPAWLGRFDWYAFSFRALESGTEIPVALARHACRMLRARGLAEYWAGIWREDGRPGGAGYGITQAGRELVEASAPPSADDEMAAALAQALMGE